MLTINGQILEEFDACESQRNLFWDMFGDKDVPLTQKTLRAAYQKGLSVGWLRKFLSQEAIDLYDRSVSLFCKTYDTVQPAAWKEYQQNNSTDEAYIEYLNAIRAAYDELRRNNIETFITVFLNDMQST